MLDPDLVLSSVVTAFRSIPEVVTEMAGNPLNIYGHYYSYGAENSLNKAILEMTSPSILVVYLDLLGGNFSGAVKWKHRMEAYIRPKNVASGTNPVGASTPHIAWLMMNKPITGMTGNIRQVSLLSGSLILMDTPVLTHKTDENMADIFCWSCVFPEWADED